MKSKIIIFLAVFSFSLLNALLIEVKQDGSGDYTTIQAGIDASANSDTVMVYPGIYYENLNMSYKNITLASLEMATNDPQYISTTIIDGQRLESCIYLHDIDTEVLIQGFTIQNGYGTWLTADDGGGIQAVYVDNGIIKNCHLRKNIGAKGGAFYTALSNLLFSGLTITNNSASLGGGAYFDNQSNISFDSENLCSIYNNNAGKGADLYSNYSVSTHVIVDTFSVFNPDRYFAEYNMDASYTFDIQNDWLELVESDLYVAADGDDNNSGLTPDDPLKNISWAVRKIEADSLNPRTIHVAAGTYSYAENQQIYPIGSKSYLSIIGENMETTILNNDYAPNTYLAQNLSGNIKFSNFTLNNNLDHTMSLIISLRHLEFLEMSNIKIDGNDNFLWSIVAEFVNCLYDNIIYTNNTAINSSGILIGEHKGIMRNCVIQNNSIADDSMHYNGQAALSQSTNELFTIENTIISDNTSTLENYPAIVMGTLPGNNGKVIMTNCQITGNSVNNENLMTISANEGTFFNNVTIANNTSSNSTIRAFGNINLRNTIMHNETNYEIFMVDESYESINELDVDNCNIKNGIDGIYNENDVNIITWGENNISDLPLFDSLGEHPFQLLSISPCIDTGTPDTTGLFLPPWDLLYNERIVDGDNDGVAIIDMGCYEFGADSVSVNLEQINSIDYQLTNYPNPFNPTTTIRFSTKESTENTEINIYNIKGQLVKKLVDAKLSAGEYQVTWNGDDEYGNKVTSGVYLYNLKTENHQSVKRMILLK